MADKEIRVEKKNEWYKRWYDGRIRLELPRYTLGEEVFSAVSHGVSALFAVAALVILLVVCRKEPLTVVSCAVFGGTMTLLYTVSTLYHALNVNRAKKVFRTLDHCTIFLLIAGTYTPITLVCLGGTKGIVLFAVVWAAAILGIVLNGISVKRFAKVSMICYIAMGWVIVFAMKDFYASAGGQTVWLLLIGGIIYTIGAVLYGVGKKIPYVHSVWHLFVFAGSFFHFLAVMNIVR